MESVCSYTAALAKYAPACTVTSVISGLATVALLYITYILFLKRGPRRAPYLPPVSAERKTKRGGFMGSIAAAAACSLNAHVREQDLAATSSASTRGLERRWLMLHLTHRKRSRQLISKPRCVHTCCAV